MIASVANPLYTASSSTAAAPGNRIPKLIAETPTVGIYDSLKINGNSVFRGHELDHDSSLISYSLNDLTQEAQYDGPYRHDDIILFFANDRYVASFTRYGLGNITYVWHRQNGQRITTIDCNRFYALSENTLVACSHTNNPNDPLEYLPALWDLSKGVLVRFLDNAKETNTFPVISGDCIFVQQPKGVIGCWNKADGAFLKNYGEEKNGVNIRAFYVDNFRLITIDEEGIYNWDRCTDQIVQSIPIFFPKNYHIENLEYKKENDTLQINSNHRIDVWDLQIEERIFSLEGLRLCCKDETSFFFVNKKSGIEVRNRSNGELTALIEGHPAYDPHEINCQSMSDLVVSSSKDGLKVWDREKGGLISVLTDEPVKDMVVSQRRIIAQIGHFLKMWEL